ncbi:MAG: hypothetical protein Q8N89_07270 [Azonexus sp.]|nr:hypothetical protein [Azonexus sp.]
MLEHAGDRKQGRARERELYGLRARDAAWRTRQGSEDGFQIWPIFTFLKLKLKGKPATPEVLRDIDRIIEIRVAARSQLADDYGGLR